MPDAHIVLMSVMVVGMHLFGLRRVAVNARASLLASETFYEIRYASVATV